MMFSLRGVGYQTVFLLGLLLSHFTVVTSHYGFPVVLINGVVSKWWEFVRPTALNAAGYQWFPDFSWDSEPMICGWGGTKTGHQTGTAKIEAGSVIGFRAFASNYKQGYVPEREFDPAMDGVGHSGPGQAYMSKAPGAIEDYEGDGDWFKISTSGASDGMHWDSDRQPEMNFTIPASTPPGLYLMYVNCAQVEVTGSGEGTPGPTVKFPGYDPADPGIWLPQAMFNPYKPSDLLKAYKGPGPEIWTG